MSGGGVSGADGVVAVPGGGSASPLSPTIFTTPGGPYSYTPTTSLILVSMCGGGGGGAGGVNSVNSAAGGGGGPSPQLLYLPVLVTVGISFNVYVGAKGTGGGAGVAGNDGTESYIQGASILSGYKDASNKISSGYGKGGSTGTGTTPGGNGGGARWSSATGSVAYGTENTGTGHATAWWYASTSGILLQYAAPICQGAGGGAVSANGGSGSGSFSVNGNGLGQSGTGTAAGGGGGGGGGSSECRGGAGGQPATPTAGQVGTGKGAGGGGGTCQAAGGDGTDGAVYIYA